VSIGTEAAQGGSYSCQHFIKRPPVKVGGEREPLERAAGESRWREHVAGGRHLGVCLRIGRGLEVVLRPHLADRVLMPEDEVHLVGAAGG
jgi:hypothetical protein